jgi:hypothetical protein
MNPMEIIHGRDESIRFDNHSFDVYKKNSLFYIKKGVDYNVEKYQKENFLPTRDAAAVDIELRVNRISVLENSDVVRVKDIETALLEALRGLGCIYDVLRAKTKKKDWVLWANIQSQLGDFDAEVDDLLGLSDEKLMKTNSKWWYMADISFANYRPDADTFLAERICNDWGDALSPLQMLFVPNFARVNEVA